MGKKVISLMLTLALCLSLAVPALAGEAPTFTDEKDIKHLEAVTALVQLGVMPAKPDGAFDPAGTLTRDQGARMLAVLMNGGDDALSDSVKTEPTFPDIGGSWAEAYIEYCADLGIVFAREDGKFDPEGELTGFELLRMALAALGYDAAAYQLIGDAWQDRTDELARIADPSLYAQLSGFAPGKAVTRDNAAQILCNALQNKAMRVVPDANEVTGAVQWRYQLGEETLLQGRFDLDTWQEFSHEDVNTAAPTLFTDATQIQHWKAAATLAQLGIVTGKDGGVFDPDGTMTRAEAAKFIALIMNGGRDITEDDFKVKETPGFPDIGGHWAEAYIEYCADRGVVNGGGDGAFAPNDQVTGLTFAKMCLTMLGYEAYTYQLTGEHWAERVDELSRQTYPSLYTDLAFSPNAPITRDNAAQMLYNALQVAPKMMTAPFRTGDDGVVRGVFVDATRKDGTPDTLFHQRFGLDEMPIIPAQP